MSQPRWDPDERRWLLDEDDEPSPRHRGHFTDARERSGVGVRERETRTGRAPSSVADLTRTEFDEDHHPRVDSRDRDDRGSRVPRPFDEPDLPDPRRPSADGTGRRRAGEDGFPDPPGRHDAGLSAGRRHGGSPDGPRHEEPGDGARRSRHGAPRSGAAGPGPDAPGPDVLGLSGPGLGGPGFGDAGFDVHGSGPGGSGADGAAGGFDVGRAGIAGRRDPGPRTDGAGRDRRSRPARHDDPLDGAAGYDPRDEPLRSLHASARDGSFLRDVVSPGSARHDADERDASRYDPAVSGHGHRSALGDTDVREPVDRPARGRDGYDDGGPPAGYDRAAGPERGGALAGPARPGPGAGIGGPVPPRGTDGHRPGPDGPDPDAYDLDGDDLDDLRDLGDPDGYHQGGPDRNGYGRNGHARNGREREPGGFERNGFEHDGFERNEFGHGGFGHGGFGRDGHELDGHERDGIGPGRLGAPDHDEPRRGEPRPDVAPEGGRAARRRARGGYDGAGYDDGPDGAGDGRGRFAGAWYDDVRPRDARYEPGRDEDDRFGNARDAAGSPGDPRFATRRFDAVRDDAPRPGPDRFEEDPYGEDPYEDDPYEDDPYGSTPDGAPRADLHDADLRDADLRDADLHDADLRDADLRDADLHDADLRHGDLRHGDLRDGDLRDGDRDATPGRPRHGGTPRPTPARHDGTRDGAVRDDEDGYADWYGDGGTRHAPHDRNTLYDGYADRLPDDRYDADDRYDDRFDDVEDDDRTHQFGVTTPDEPPGAVEALDAHQRPGTGEGEGRRRRTRRWPWILGGIVVLGGLAVPVVSGMRSGPADQPVSSSGAVDAAGYGSGAGAAAPQPAPDTGAQQAPAGEVTFQVTGSGTASTITYSRGPSISQASGVPLPWEQKVPGAPGGSDYALTAQSSGAAQEISCTITVDGVVVAEQKAKGSYAAVSCVGRR